MRILAVDDEPFPLQELCDAIQEADPEGECVAFTLPSKALEFVKTNPIDAAVLDVELGSMNGIILAKKLKDIQPDAAVVFVTGYQQYAVDAFQVRASGYLLKPAAAEDVTKELEYIRSWKKGGPAEQRREPEKVTVKTFGGFDVFIGEKPLIFKRMKSKELFAYLVDRRGNSVTTREACGILFEDDAYDENQSGYFRSLVSDLRKTLGDAGVGDILIRSRNSLAIDPDKLDCDAYRFLQGDPVAVNSYHRDYMICYSWSEFSVGLFEPEL